MGGIWTLNAGERIRIRHRLARTLPTACELCGQVVNESDSWDVDHIIPINEQPDLAFEMSNVRVTHSMCNRRRGAGLRPDPSLCMKGHKLEGDNVRYDGRNGRHCRACQQLRHEEKSEEYNRTFRQRHDITPGPAFSRGERLPPLLERGVCRNGHEINSLDDVLIRARPGHPGEQIQQCRECRRQPPKASTTRDKGTLLERGVCRNGHEIATIEDVEITPRPGRPGETRQQCRECKREHGRRSYDRSVGRMRKQQT